MNKRQFKKNSHKLLLGKTEDKNYDNTKKCKRCGAVKAICEYHKQSRNKDGRYNICKDCRCAEARIYRLNKSKTTVLTMPIFTAGDYVVAETAIGSATFKIVDIYYGENMYYLFSDGEKFPVFVQSELRKATKFEKICFIFWGIFGGKNAKKS